MQNEIEAERDPKSHSHILALPDGVTNAPPTRPNWSDEACRRACTSKHSQVENTKQQEGSTNQSHTSLRAYQKGLPAHTNPSSSIASYSTIIIIIMPKAEKGSLKDLGKQIKAKGLQKLRFYCQMCEKQCRDANGFKCHLTSDSHLRSMKIFSENSGRILNGNSREFETMFLDTLRMRHSTAKVNANQVYQQVIADKNHVHMNSTIWSTLSGFVQYLGKTGKCIVEETERGWYMTYINRDVGKLQREEQQRQRQQDELEAESISQQRLDVQRVEAAKALDRATGGVVNEGPTGITAGEAKVELSLKNTIIGNVTNAKKRKMIVSAGNPLFDDDEEEEEESKEDGKVHDKNAMAARQSLPRPPLPLAVKPPPPSLTRPAHQPPQAHSTTKKAKTLVPGAAPDDDTPWLLRNIMVRLVNKKLCDGKYYRRKARVDRLEDDGFTAIVTMVEEDGDGSGGGDVLKLDQDDLETVIPKKVGERVTIVRSGEHRGATAVVTALNKDKCRADLELLATNSSSNGTRLLRKVPYDDFSKSAE
jgi:DNA/RNA-binding protein KIN17